MSELEYTTKRCSKCGKRKHVTEFYSKRTECKSCAKEVNRVNNEKRKVTDPNAKRRHSLKLRYGITLEQYNELLEQQDGKCPVCLKHHTEFPRNLAVDHNHKTGEIRGLLCNNCNHRLIGRHTDTDLVTRMAEYISRHTGWYVPKKKRPVKRKPKK